MNELIQLTARHAVELLRKGEVSPLELVDAAADRIGAVEKEVNALPTLCLDKARSRAKKFITHSQDNPPPYYLYGLPIAVKDLEDVAGVSFLTPISAG